LSELEPCDNSDSFHQIWANGKPSLKFWVKFETFE